MEAEAAPIVQCLGLKLDEPRIIPAPSSAHSYSGNVHELSVHLVVNGERCGFLVIERDCESQRDHVLVFELILVVARQ